MLRGILIGTVAGALGTVAINMVNYGDMAIRGRSASSTPSKIAGILADKVGLPLSAQGEKHDQTVQNRESGLGALLGYMNGLGVGAAYGLLRSQLDDVSIPLAGIGIGLLAMAASDVPTVTLGVSNPKTWRVSDWASDIIPHLIYGLVTAAACEVLTNAD